MTIESYEWSSNIKILLLKNKSKREQNALKTVKLLNYIPQSLK